MKKKAESQHQQFVRTARELDCDDDERAFRRAVRKIATAPVTKPKKAARKPKS